MNGKSGTAIRLVDCAKTFPNGTRGSSFFDLVTAKSSIETGLIFFNRARAPSAYSASRSMPM